MSETAIKPKYVEDLAQAAVVGLSAIGHMLTGEAYTAATFRLTAGVDTTGTSEKLHRETREFLRERLADIYDLAEKVAEFGNNHDGVSEVDMAVINPALRVMRDALGLEPLVEVDDEN